MAIQRSKYTGDRMNYQGDPGIFSFLKKTAQVGLGLAGMLPGVGGVARALGGAIFPPAPGTTTYAQDRYISRMPSVPTGMPGSGQTVYRSGPSASLPSLRGASPCPYPQYLETYSGSCEIQQRPGVVAAIQAAVPYGETGQYEAIAGVNGAMAGRPAVTGYHWNKSGYFLKSGEYVSAGTKMVKNRRRNPANPRATSNAITRIKGAKRYAKSLSAISIRKKC